MKVTVGAVYLVDFKTNIDGEINGKRYAIVISEISSKDKTLLVVPITGKKKGIKYRGGFTIDNSKYLNNPKYEKGFAKVRKIREIAFSRLVSKARFTLDDEDLKQLKESIKGVITVLK